MYSLYDQVTGKALALLSKIYRHTCPKHWVGIEKIHLALDSGRPLVFTSWHGCAYMIISSLLSFIDPSSFHVLMPNDWRGGTLAVLTLSLGANPYPMNLFGDPSLGMGRELVKVVRHIMKGGGTFIAPDGPDGPAYVAKPGVIYLAKKAGAIVIPLGGYARHAYHLNRWDHYALPYPFSRISIHVGDPFTIDSQQDDKEMRQVLTDTLHRVTAQAAANYYADRRRWRKD